MITLYYYTSWLSGRDASFYVFAYNVLSSGHTYILHVLYQEITDSRVTNAYTSNYLTYMSQQNRHIYPFLNVCHVAMRSCYPDAGVAPRLTFPLKANNAHVYFDN